MVPWPRLLVLLLPGCLAAAFELRGAAPGFGNASLATSINGSGFDGVEHRALLGIDLPAPLTMRLAAADQAIRDLVDRVTALYGTDEKTMTHDTMWYDTSAKDKHLVRRMARAVVKGEPFVISIGGMSDTAGHGNLASESYPAVMFEALKAPFQAAGVELVVRNLAMGGVPSFPNTLCMADAFGADSDIVAWDFRMVEHDDVKGELFIRQALLLPKQPAVMFKRKNRYLPALAPLYASIGSLHAVDEMDLYNHLHQHSDALNGDKFCEGDCTCPGQVRWHAGWKMQRLRGLQLAMVYAKMLAKAVQVLRTALDEGQNPALMDWGHTIKPIPKAKNPVLKSKFSDYAFQCGMSWNPHVGRSLTDIVDRSQLAKGGTHWASRDPNKSISDKGKRCGYKDDKTELEGTVESGWIWFVLPGVSAEGAVGFCADLPQKKKVSDLEVLIMLNNEEAQHDLDFWLDSRTLGISIQCYGISKPVLAGENTLGFRVMESDLSFKITHVFWR